MLPDVREKVSDSPVNSTLRYLSVTSPEYLSRIAPHGREDGGGYYIGTAYDAKPPQVASEWELADGRPRPYLEHIKAASRVLPHLRYLADWMEVSCAPPKWCFIRLKDSIRAERAARTNVCMIDYRGGRVNSHQRFQSAASLTAALSETGNDHDQVEARLFVVEDLSRDVVESLGARFAIQPTFFREHISDYLWFNTSDRWSELPQLHASARRRTHFCMQWAQPRYFDSEASFVEAQLQAGAFNVLRRLDPDNNTKSLDMKGSSVALTRSKASLWIRPNRPHEAGLLAVLVIDPTLGAGYPLWGKGRNFYDCPEFGAPVPDYLEPPSASLFEEVIFGSSDVLHGDMGTLTHDPRILGFAIYRIILADWLKLIKYIGARLGQIDWEIEQPSFRLNPYGVDFTTLKKLHFWRRHVPNYLSMIEESRDRLFPAGRAAQSARTESLHSTLSLLQDFDTVLRKMEGVLARIEGIVAVATTVMSIEESQRSLETTKIGLEQNRRVTLLTNLATVFVPMSFVATVFSMAPDITSLTQTYWIYFVVSLPVTIMALIMVDFLHIQEYLRRLLRWRKG